MEEYSIKFGEKNIDFKVQRKNVKNINLNIQPNMDVIVSASNEVPLEYILNFVKRKAGWIIKRKEYFKEVLPEGNSIKELVSGESYKYLGRQYRLRVEYSEKEFVKFEKGFIYLYVKDILNTKRKERLLNNWFKERAVFFYNEILNKQYLSFSKYNVEKPIIEIRKMKARWGSCLKNSNKIIINFDLIKAPKYCIEYVILHELIHFIYTNHDEKFYNMLNIFMPDWKKRKKILDEEIARFL
ncbi:M48 family metallopeptidase [Caloramator quimbayensis]|nr:SprT family zinc-dependent metalloprotease [Caloramator quimbayensis]